ncbi:MAG: hypothetical protein MJY71_01600 [Bacteroidaceae bacterium]|nr:hypothetical protein [Bacteroidaceae bacterium]
MKIKMSYLLFMLLFSCQSETWQVQKTVRKLIGKEIMWSNVQQYVYADTVLEANSANMQSVLKPIKVITYIDSVVCSSCFANYLRGTVAFTDIVNSDSVQYICVMNSRQITAFQEAIQDVDCPRSLVVFDVSGNYLMKNGLENYTDMFRTFLLDKYNHVVLVGDPLRNNDIQDLYVKSIRSMINNDGVAIRRKSLLKNIE